jgi:flagellar capping protein FliD
MNSGRNGRIVLDSGTTGLNTRQLVEAQDAAVFIGGSSGAEPLLVTGSSNQLTGILPGVNIDLHAVSNNPVSLNITRSSDSLVETMDKYVKNFNDLIDGIGILTAFDADTNTSGLLMGDAAVQGVQAALYEGLTKIVIGAGQYRTLADVGLTIADGAKLEFDEDKFRSAYAANPTDVEKLFTAMDRITTTKTTVGGTLANGISGGSVVNNVVTGGTTTTTTTTNGPTVPNGTTTDGAGTSTTTNGITTTIGATIYQNNTTTIGRGFGYLIEKALTKLTDPVDGLIPRTNDNIDSRVADYRSRIDSLTELLTQKRSRLETQFASMERAISNLQSQQSALNSFKPLSYSTSSN